MECCPENHPVNSNEIGLRKFDPSAEVERGYPCPYLFTESEAVRYLRLDTIDIAHPEETLKRYRKEGLLRGTQLSKRVFYLRKELDDFLVKLTSNNPR